MHVCILSNCISKNCSFRLIDLSAARVTVLRRSQQLAQFRCMQNVIRRLHQSFNESNNGRKFRSMDWQLSISLTCYATAFLTSTCLGSFRANWLTTVASSPTPTQEDCTRLTLVRYSSVGRAPTAATEPPVQLDPESGTECRQTSDSRTYHTAVSDSRRRRFYLDSWTKANVNPPPTLTALQKCSYLLTYLLTYYCARKRLRLIDRTFFSTCYDYCSILIFCGIFCQHTGANATESVFLDVTTRACCVYCPSKMGVSVSISFVHSFIHFISFKQQ